MFKVWSYNPTQNRYTGAYDTCEHLPAGLYELNTNSYDEPYANRLELRKDDICLFSSGPLNGVLKEMNTFWDNRAYYKQLGVSHKRGILLYGPPGNGKTSVISAAIQNTVDRNGIVCQFNDVDGFIDCIPLLRQIEPDRPIVVTMEDLETLLSSYEEDILELMDGASSVCDSILFLATTNKLTEIPHRIRSRPSRIDTVIEIGVPLHNQREEYLKFLLKKSKLSSNNCGRFIAEVVKKTDKFSLAMLKELVLATQVYNKTVDEAIAVLQEMAKEVENG